MNIKMHIMNRLLFCFAVSEIQVPDTYHGTDLSVKVNSYSNIDNFPGKM
jgi:hypothetical protein